MIPRALQVWQLPLDLGLAGGAQGAIDRREGSAAEEAIVGRERRRVRGLDDRMARSVDQDAFLLRIAAPEHENDGIFSGIDGTNNGIGEDLPAVALVGVGHVRAHRQHGIEQQHPLFCPGDEVAIIGDAKTHVAAQLFEDVNKRRRWLNAWAHGETETVGLIIVVVGVLAQQEDVCVLVRSQFQGGEDILFGRKDGVLPSLLIHKLLQRLEVGLFELVGELCAPVFGDIYQHSVDHPFITNFQALWVSISHSPATGLFTGTKVIAVVGSRQNVLKYLPVKSDLNNGVTI